MARLRLATVWLAGCSGCHMSFLDLDEWLIELASQADLVYSPLLDLKEYPEDVDVALVEGAIANEDNLTLIRQIRARTRCLVAFGDCAVTGNVTALRNPQRTALPVLQRAYVELADLTPGLPALDGILPRLFDQVVPLHKVVPVDLFMLGCPPAPARIRRLLESLLAGEKTASPAPDLCFG